MTTLRFARLILMLLTAHAACAPPKPRPAPVQNTESSPTATLCDGLHPGPPDTPGIVDAKLQCGHYRDEFLPQVAARAVECMESATWDACHLSPCTEAALTSRPAEMDKRCKQVGQACPAMTDLCASHIAGMNPTGRDRFATCLVDHCGYGVRFCLWDSMVTACD